MVTTRGYISFSLLCLILWTLPTVAMAETNTDSFYGGQSLNSLVVGEKIKLNLPGGARTAIAIQETDYTLTDHLQSGRMAVKANNTISEPMTYTPFGDAEMRERVI